MTLRFTYLHTALVGVLLLPLFAVADSVTITNTITTSSNTGGNTATGGQVIEGTSENSIEVISVVNEEVVEEYSETSSEDLSYEHTYAVETGEGEITIQATTEDLETGMEEEEGSIGQEQNLSDTIKIPEIDDEVIVSDETEEVNSIVDETGTTTGQEEEEVTDEPQETASTISRVLAIINSAFSGIFAYALNWF